MVRDMHQAAYGNQKTVSVLKTFLRSFRGYQKQLTLSLMFLPVIVYFLVFHYFPMYGVTLAFKNYSLSKGIIRSPWVGLVNFRKLLMATEFARAFRNTVIISALKLACGFPMPIILALLLNEVRSIRYKKIVQTVSYLPHFLSWVILSGMFMQLLSPSNGIINYILGLAGIKPIFFMADNRWFRTVLIVTDIWKGMGWGSIVYLAAIAGINPELYEAADCDGATRGRKTVSITLPLLAPTIAVVFILNVGGIMNAGFDQIFNMYTTSVLQTADIIDTYVYRNGMGQMQYSMATAAGLYKNTIGFAMVVLTNVLSKKISGNGIW
ncbi:sugar ABC transporter permease [Clostridia bacterium]|nr:sugar ABC transporter permease [Clostridia bacterium]